MKSPPHPSRELGEANGLFTTNDPRTSQHELLLRFSVRRKSASTTNAPYELSRRSPCCTPELPEDTDDATHQVDALWFRGRSHLDVFVRSAARCAPASWS